ncbi:DYH2 protein, partial [Polypterus senegalus]
MAKKKWDSQRDAESRQEYKEIRHKVKREVAKAKEKVYVELYERLDTKEGEKDLYRLARQRDGAGKDVQQVRVIKDKDENVLTSKAYPSLKPLGSWTRDLVHRVEQFSKWAETTHPPVLFWLSGFTFPTGFLTAVLQASARQNNISVDTLSWEFIVSTVDDNNLLYPPKDGVFVKGLYLEGAGWDKKNSCLVEAEPMQLVCPMPTIHFRPVEKKKSGKGIYSCPCYYFPNRAGAAGRASFVVGVDLKAGAMTADHWIKRGTALLMSLDT